MPYRLDTHVLTVDANVIHKVDTGNPANLYSMWTVFSRCADSVEQGRRLENLSWRLWQREQLIDCAHRSSIAPTAPKDIPSEARLPELPQLSGSVDSLADEDAPEFTSVSAPLEIRPRIRRVESSASRRDRHISSDDFEKMVVSIVKDKAPLSAPSSNNSSPIIAITRSGSTTTESQSSEQRSEVSLASAEMMSSTIAASPKHLAGIPVFNAPPMDDSFPEPSSSPAHRPVQSKRQPPKFALGGSVSSSDCGQSLDAPKSIMTAAAKKPMFKLGGSSEEDSSMSSSRNLPSAAKQTSFSNHNITHHLDAESAIDSDTEGEYIDESAIDDDDDSSDWEDSIDESGKPSVDEKFFQRVESKVNLASRPSLITLMMADDRAKSLGNHASQSTSALHRSRSAFAGSSLAASPNDSDDGPLMMKGARQTALKPINEIPRSSAQPIAAAATTNHVYAHAALSPRTTRRNMLATELTESLRRHLLWERQQKSSTANAVLKRRHTSHDVANLRQYPERACLKQSEDVNASSWNQYLTKEANNGYHSKGW
ncbi:DUF1752 domain-containing protein [Trichoderma austrokoningii]